MVQDGLGGNVIEVSISVLRILLCVVISIFISQNTVPWWVILFFAVSALDLRWKPKR